MHAAPLAINPIHLTVRRGRMTSMRSFPSVRWRACLMPQTRLEPAGGCLRENKVMRRDDAEHGPLAATALLPARH